MEKSAAESSLESSWALSENQSGECTVCGFHTKEHITFGTLSACSVEGGTQHLEL